MLRDGSCAFLSIALVVGACAAYQAAYWAWVTATPVTPERLEAAQHRAYAWLAVAMACAVVVVTMLVRAVRGR
jgi:hypothetical protein